VINKTAWYRVHNWYCLWNVR